jgi:hypothetical protein
MVLIWGEGAYQEEVVGALAEEALVALLVVVASPGAAQIQEGALGVGASLVEVVPLMVGVLEGVEHHLAWRQEEASVEVAGMLEEALLLEDLLMAVAAAVLELVAQKVEMAAEVHQQTADVAGQPATEGSVLPTSVLQGFHASHPLNLS